MCNINGGFEMFEPIHAYNETAMEFVEHIKWVGKCLDLDFDG